MKVKLYKPQNPLLQQYIECFYTLRRTPDEAGITYRAFPSVFSMVCLNTKTNIELLKEAVVFNHCPHKGIETAVTCNFGHSGLVRYEGEMDEIVIYFKPLGINAFLEKHLKQYVHSHFAKFDPFDDYRAAMTEIFSIAGDKKRIAALENYWLAKHKGFEHAFLHPVINEIMASGGATSLSRAARQNGISRPTLNKHFDLHIGTTPSQFKKIVRFRNAMKQHRQKFSAENLTDISYSAEYFDQSHMIKDFKSLTKYSPKDFFAKISSFEDGHINWLFL